METVQKNDFVEIEFNGIANNQIFDTTNKEEAKKIGLDADVKPLIISIGNDMIIKGFDEYLPGKEIQKKYTLVLSQEKAFGKRNPSMIKTMPIKVFLEKDMYPSPGMTIQLDNYIAKILSVSGGRVIVDFNNPLAGKEVTYEFEIKRKVEDIKEKINALQEFFFREKYDFEIKDKKVLLKNKKPDPKEPLGEKKLNFLIEIYKKKFHEIIDFDFEIDETAEKKKAEKIEEKTDKIEEKQQ
ncbi:FKBP-type peptidyl-prolyl cis-trans isomerase [Candidatus Pacearchaeota archaeon]|nr:FKBP-type peptidyl-prolyl cis-trans isomerase [Candidatus Pacearchaeota archaeon]